MQPWALTQPWHAHGAPGAAPPIGPRRQLAEYGPGKHCRRDFAQASDNVSNAELSSMAGGS